MARFLFVTWDGGGNVNPVLAMTQRLIGRGHDVDVIGSASLVDRFAAAGVPLQPRDDTTEWDVDVTADDTIAAAARAEPDVLVVDYMQPGALCGAEASGVPTVAFVHTLYGAMVVGGDLVTMYMAATLDAVQVTCARLGLPAVARMAELVERCAAAMVTAPRELDVDVVPLPDNVCYVGPVLEAPVRRVDGDRDVPNVVVSMGTTDMGERAVLEKVLAAAGELPVRVRATVGHRFLDPRSVVAPANTTVTGYVPHAELLRDADLLVCHGGLGGIVAAMSYGVPVLAVPLGRDQPANGAAVERAGIGRCVQPDAPVEELRAAMDDLLRRGAADLSGAAAAYGERCVEVLESLVRGR